jgi:uncharacterized protein with GYD domain
MPKYLIQASYTAEGLNGLQKDEASGRRAAIATSIESLGGRLEALHFCFGERSVHDDTPVDRGRGGQGIGEEPELPRSGR